MYRLRIEELLKVKLMMNKRIITLNRVSKFCNSLWIEFFGINNIANDKTINAPIANSPNLYPNTNNPTNGLANKIEKAINAKVIKLTDFTNSSGIDSNSFLKNFS